MHVYVMKVQENYINFSSSFKSRCNVYFLTIIHQNNAIVHCLFMYIEFLKEMACSIGVAQAVIITLNILKSVFLYI